MNFIKLKQGKAWDCERDKMKRKSKWKTHIILIGVLLCIILIILYINNLFRRCSPILVETVYKYEKGHDWEGRWRGVRIEVHYPQIQSRSDTDDITNIALRDTAFSFFDDLEEEPTYEEVIRSFEEENENPRWIEIVKIEYEVLHCTKDYVSVIFSVEAEDAARLYINQYVATIDVKTGQYIHLQDIMDLKQLSQILANNQFEVIEGTYCMLDEEGVRAPENIIQFIRDFEEGLKQRDINQEDYGQKVYTNVDQHYCRFSCKNIGMDKEGLYIYFRDGMAFEGYFIFRIPWEDISYSGFHGSISGQRHRKEIVRR